MSDQQNIHNNQNTYRSSDRSDSYSSNTRAAEPNTRVLSDDERRDFDGVFGRIDDAGPGTVICGLRDICGSDCRSNNMTV